MRFHTKTQLFGQSLKFQLVNEDNEGEVFVSSYWISHLKDISQDVLKLWKSRRAVMPFGTFWEVRFVFISSLCRFFVALWHKVHWLDIKYSVSQNSRREGKNKEDIWKKQKWQASREMYLQSMKRSYNTFWKKITVRFIFPSKLINSELPLIFLSEWQFSYFN